MEETALCFGVARNRSVGFGANHCVRRKGEYVMSVSERWLLVAMVREYWPYVAGLALSWIPLWLLSKLARWVVVAMIMRRKPRDLVLEIRMRRMWNRTLRAIEAGTEQQLCMDAKSLKLLSELLGRIGGQRAQLRRRRSFWLRLLLALVGEDASAQEVGVRQWRAVGRLLYGGEALAEDGSTSLRGLRTLAANTVLNGDDDELLLLYLGATGSEEMRATVGEILRSRQTSDQRLSDATAAVEHWPDSTRANAMKLLGQSRTA